MVPDPKLLRTARRARERADRLEVEARRLEKRAGIDRIGIGVALGKISPHTPAAHRAILAAGLTLAQAAEACGTTAGVLKKAWATGSQFRPPQREWLRVLARYGVSRHVWRVKP